MDDKQIEKLWIELEDITMYENKDSVLCLSSEWNGFEAGTDQNTIWGWFNHNHSRGLQYLVNEME